MATTFYQIQYWTWTLAPGQAVWLSYGPSDRYRTGTVLVTCSPDTASTGTAQVTQTISVPETFNTVVPTVSGDLVFKNAYTGFNVTNRGGNTIKYFSVAISVIGP
ncbi:hypothetical protein [Goodfellowiella coeruleoviolacea]|uniref:Uncharacterized protein n=1 Tax=Goodfellowiella coeruleoviolacea TaxID=334858 RepID=A0AAE3GBH9_9PSEU|nr:hypothetical protein [Goodfellowiella coeruleoviolacea]MCP2164763.1 hypothetical protein [Goodfellowiella coeruleoviolacea]